MQRSRIRSVSCFFCFRSCFTIVLKKQTGLNKVILVQSIKPSRQMINNACPHLI
ncbi:hypothetical protein NEILACOT_04004 [Neisseria lactamica ATCC 23970]|uniref:Uncharacterized protein n=1 Tax=Neisseria lactamica ATCC 23970 TaxID=546265 RepID=D0W8Z8_NEILA|nr:hypothetical protein NEILACOT_04004 [Neisseria lactamica ATCC 23970]